MGRLKRVFNSGNSGAASFDGEGGGFVARGIVSSGKDGRGGENGRDRKARVELRMKPELSLHSETRIFGVVVVVVEVQGERDE